MTKQPTTPTTMMLTKNTDKLRREVAAHVAADSVAQGSYTACIIGCLSGGNRPDVIEREYGLPVMVQRIAEGIFESLPADEAVKFFAAVADAVDQDNKDLSKVSWQFLAAELRSLPAQPAEIQAVIDPVIAGMDLMAAGKEWPAAAVRAADWAARAARAAARAAEAVDQAAARAARAAARAALAADLAAEAAARAAEAADLAAEAADWAVDQAADLAARAADCAADLAADLAARAADCAADLAAARIRQRDLLLRLIQNAPVIEVSTND